MSGDDDHKRGDRIEKFCTEPRDTICGDCPGTKNYKDVCKPRWSKQVFKRLVKRKKKNGGPFVMEKRYEAHHILCVSPVTKELLGNKKIRGAIEQTQWCINNKTNMKAMPLWGHTVKWYCSFDEEDDGSISGTIKSRSREPPFKNIPQHDFDHNSSQGYTWEVQEDMKKLACDVQESGHKLQGKSLADTLDEHSKDFAKELKKRGIRKDGTHNGWKLAQKGEAEWCHPFSMASDGRVTDIAFPGKDFEGKLDAWIDRIAKGIAGLG